MITMPYVMYQNQNGNAGTDYPEPFVALTLTMESGVVYGDVNGDGTINVVDASCILQYINGTVQLTETELLAADVSGDGSINVTDVSLILQYINGTITEFSVHSKP